MPGGILSSRLPFSEVAWRPIKTNGGGLVTGLFISDDGTKFCATDVGGAYKYDDGNSKWSQLVTGTSLKQPYWGNYRQQSGSIAIATPPADSSTIYLTQRDATFNDNLVWKSSDGGATFSHTNYAANTSTYMNPNGDSTRQYQSKIAVDPNNASVIYALNPGGSPRVSFDAGASWSDISALPSGTTIGAICIAFDHTSGTTGGRTNKIYIPINGSGVYLSSDAGATWAQISSTIVAPTGSSGIDSSGVFYISHTISTTRYISKYDGNWTNILSNSSNRYVLAVDRSASGKVYALRSNDLQLDVTSNGGASWTSHSKASQTFSSGDTGWYASEVQTIASVSGFCVNPNATAELWATVGQGVMKTTYSGAAPTWTAVCSGIEELVVNDINHEAGKSVIVSGWDEKLWVRPKAALDSAPSSNYFYDLGLTGINKSWTFERDPQNANYCVTVGDSASLCGYSTDDLATFNAFATIPSGAPVSLSYDSIAVNNGVIIWIPARSTNQAVFRSADNGGTWSSLSISGVPSSGDTGWTDSIQTAKKYVVADRVDAGTFYISNRVSGQTPDCRGVWKSTDGGINWTLGTQPYASSSFYIRIMRSVPGKQGHLFVCSGHVSPSDSAKTVPVSGTGFYYSTDGGSTWTIITNVLMVSAFGFGKPRTSYPTVFFAGFYKRVYGIYIMDDNDPTTIRRLESSGNPWPMNLTDSVTCVEGDKDIYGRCYVGFEGNGSAYCDLG